MTEAKKPHEKSSVKNIPISKKLAKQLIQQGFLSKPPWQQKTMIKGTGFSFLDNPMGVITQYASGKQLAQAIKNLKNQPYCQCNIAKMLPESSEKKLETYLKEPKKPFSYYTRKMFNWIAGKGFHCEYDDHSKDIKANKQTYRLAIENAKEIRPFEAFVSDIKLSNNMIKHAYRKNRLDLGEAHELLQLALLDQECLHALDIIHVILVNLESKANPSDTQKAANKLCDNLSQNETLGLLAAEPVGTPNSPIDYDTVISQLIEKLSAHKNSLNRLIDPSGQSLQHKKTSQSQSTQTPEPGDRIPPQHHASGEQSRPQF